MNPSERAAVIERLRINDWHGCILGPEGTGKTTLLEDISAAIAEDRKTVEWVRLTLESSPEERRDAVQRVTRMGAGTCCFFDGGEVLGWLGWRRLIRAVRKGGCGLVATVHRRCPLPVVYRTETTSNEALSLAKELAGPTWNRKMEAAAESAFRESRGDTREVFRACY